MARFQIGRSELGPDTRFEVQLRYESGESPDEFRTAYLGPDSRCEIQGNTPLPVRNNTPL